jgi:hypothetical protein
VPIIATAGESNKTYAPAPAGVHHGVCVDVVDMGMLEVTYAGKTKQQHKIRLVWQIDETNPETGERFIAQKRYTLSLNEKATLRKDLEGWRGRAFTRDEEMGFDVEKLISVNAFINVVHAQKDGKTYANVVSIMPLKKGMPKMDADRYVRVKDRKPDDQAQTHGEITSELTEDDIPF